METSKQLRQRGQESWDAAVKHPMVLEIVRGQLPKSKFRYYFEQNILYLEEYARAIALVAAKAPDHRALDVLSRFLREIVAGEIPSNHAFLERLGGSPEELDRRDMSQITYSYTRHLMQTASYGDCASGLAAILPCQWSYGELSRPLMQTLPEDPVFADWISMFGNDDYDALIGETTRLLDRLVDPGDQGSLDNLLQIFDLSSKFEAKFWEMAYEGHGWD